MQFHLALVVIALIMKLLVDAMNGYEWGAVADLYLVVVTAYYLRKARKNGWD